MNCNLVFRMPLSKGEPTMKAARASQEEEEEEVENRTDTQDNRWQF